MATDVYVADCGYGVYAVMVDGEVYDTLISRGHLLSWSQQRDIEVGYKEGLL